MSAIQDAIDEIEDFIVANGNEEITADVLRPLLVGLGNAVKNTTGDPANLNTLSKNLVNAINELKAITDGLTGVVILSGTTNPNTTPPLTYALGNFYARYSGSTLLSFWQYNGNEWIQIISQKKRIFSTSDGNYTIQSDDYTVIYEDGVASNDINIGNPIGQRDKILRIVNRDSDVLNILDGGYINYSEVALTTIPANSSITIQSDNTSWNLI